MPITVLIGEEIGAANLARLREAFPEVTFLPCASEEALVSAAPQAEIIFSKRLPADAVRRATKLRWVQAGTAGIGHFVDAGIDGRRIILTNASGAHGVPMAEMILGMMLAFATGLHALIRVQREHRLVRSAVVAHKFELEGQTLCVLGLGDIGGTLASKAAALGMDVIGVRRSAKPFPDLICAIRPDGLLDVLPRADRVALRLPLTPETRGMVGEAELRAMKASAYIYNVGRGASIEPEALLRALREGWIAGAGLDVTAPEPPPPDSALWEMPNVILSQHTSGSSPHNADRITDILIDNLGRYLRGEPLHNRIDPARGY